MSDTLYHISLDVDTITEVFKPTLYSMVYKEENRTFPHISLSSSVEGCLSGVPWGGRKLEGVSTGIFDMTEEELYGVFRVYEFDKKDIAEENFISTDKLLEEGLVMDANNSDECWVVRQHLIPSKTYIVVLTGYDETITDVFCQDYYLLTEEDDSEDIEEYIIGGATRITDISIETYEKKEDIPYDIDWEEWFDFLEEIKEDNYELSW